MQFKIPSPWISGRHGQKVGRPFCQYNMMTTFHVSVLCMCSPFKETNAFGAFGVLLMLSLFKILNSLQIFSPPCFPGPPPRLTPRAQLWERHQHQHQRTHLHKYICLTFVFFIHSVFFQILTCGQKSRVDKIWAAAASRVKTRKMPTKISISSMRTSQYPLLWTIRKQNLRTRLRPQKQGISSANRV